MGGLSRGFNWWWQYFYDRFYILGPHVRGQITLPFGKQEVNISLGHGHISQVYLHDYPAGAIPVCAGDLNYFACVEGKHDFTIYADIHSNTTTVYWIAMLVQKPFFVPGQ